MIINSIKYYEHELQLTNETNTSSQNKETVNCTHLYVFLGLFSVTKNRMKFWITLFHTYTIYDFKFFYYRLLYILISSKIHLFYMKAMLKEGST
jgi:hypothetical protein